MERIEKGFVVGLAAFCLFALAVRSQSHEALSAHHVEPDATELGRYGSPRPISYGSSSAPSANRGPHLEVDVEPIEPAPRTYWQEVPVQDEPEIVYEDGEVESDLVQELLQAILDEVEEPEVVVESDWISSDQFLMDEMMSVLDPQQQLAFRELWRSMSRAERQEWLMRLRYELGL